MKLTQQQTATFQETVWEYFRSAGRPMPWRENPEPYYVLVSELMLQQTQVPRVIPKFQDFIRQFPNIETLAAASLADVLAQWNSLGYNRRAKFLHQAVKMIINDFGGHMPDTYENLIKLPGVGPNTAGAILAYAHNQPVVFIETNIRTVYIHHFFHDQFDVDDKQIRELVEQTLGRENPREWYWALMDYGTYLKQTLPSRNSQSKHYKKQSPLAGSVREMRGRILRVLIDAPLDENTLRESTNADERFEPAMQALEHEGMIIVQNKKWSLTGGTDIR
jgi:A/G-specific adenine glycosylase